MARFDPARDEDGKFDRSEDERIRQVNVRFTSSEAAELYESARASGMTVSDYVRHRSLGWRLVSRVDREMIALLNKLGGLQKHWFNELKIQPEKTVEILTELAEAVREISGKVKERKAEEGGEQ